MRSKRLASAVLFSFLVTCGPVTGDAPRSDRERAANEICAAANRTILNPAPLDFDHFGAAVAKLGSSVLVGAPDNDGLSLNDGAVYVVNPATGAVNLTIPHPSGSADARFGSALAALQGNIVASAPGQTLAAVAGSGAVYAISPADGSLIFSIPNPVPGPSSGDDFGASLAVVGGTHLLIGAPTDDAFGFNEGAAYLYLNTAMVLSLSNATGAIGDRFGDAVGSIFTDLLVGAENDNVTVGTNNMLDAGSVYRFGFDGTPLAPLNEPFPSGAANFGAAIATGTSDDRIFVGAPGANTVHVFEGGSGGYAFEIPDPNGATADEFGESIAITGDNILIGAPDASGGGAVYLFDSAGTLLATYANPSPAIGDTFGAALSSLGTDLIIGNGGDDTGAGDAGAVYFVSGNATPTANGMSVMTNEEVPVSFTLTGTDPNGDPLTWGINSDPTKGVLSGTLPNLTYTPNPNSNGSDSFTFEARDACSFSTPAIVSITINALNDSPIAGDDAYSVNEDGLLSVSTPGLLGNDSDVDLDGRTAVLFAGPSSGTLNTFNADGSFSYTGNGNFSGDDTFTYRAFDGTSFSNIATVTITVDAVNDVPINVVPGVQAFGEDTTLTLSAGNSNAITTSDADGATALITLTAANGTMTLGGTSGLSFSTGNGVADATMVFTSSIAEANAALDGMVFTPNLNFTGASTITILHDDQGSTGIGGAQVDSDELVLDVQPANDAPVADDDAYMTDEDMTLNVAAAGVLIGDTDVDAATTLTAAVVTNVANGMLTLNADGSFTYMPNANFNGDDTFTYRASDGALNSNLATVTITVNALNDAPTGVADAKAVAEDAMLAVNAASGVLTNDTDVDSATLTAALVTDVADGVLALAADGSFTYTPDANFNGTDSFTYRANDGALNSGSTTVTITVSPVGDAPLAGDDLLSVAEDGSVTITAADGVLENDSDIDSGAITAVVVTLPAYGALNLASNGAFSYTPDENYNGPDAFTYVANDGGLDSPPATVSITVTPVNDLPSVPSPSSPLAGAILSDGAVAFEWAASTDVDGDVLQYHLEVIGDGLVFEYLGPATSAIIPINESLEGGTYFWRVDALDPAGSSGFSTASNFEVRGESSGGCGCTLDARPASRSYAWAVLVPLALFFRRRRRS